MSIDFSKAPEGATHYTHEIGILLWYKMAGGTVYYRNDKDLRWCMSTQYKTLDGLLRIPAFEPLLSVEDAQTTGNKHDPATAKQASPKGVGVPILGMVLADLTNRALEGRQKYGEPLLAHNGRNPLWDAYQEALDLAMYLRQAIEESK